MFISLSPEYQPNGKRSYDYAIDLVLDAFHHDGYKQVE